MSTTFATLSLMALITLAPHVVITRMFAETPLNADIPFDFTVGNTNLSAGRYTITYGSSGTVRIASEDGKASCMVLTNAVQAARTPRAGKLVFNRYRKFYFLSEIWNSGYDQGRALPRSKTEREVAANAATQVASVAAAQR
jgi:hypothetical protein